MELMANLLIQLLLDIITKMLNNNIYLKHQSLQAAGFSGGKITELSWETTAQNGATSNFYGFTIRMGCTNQNSINNWQSGLSTVFSPQTVTSFFRLE